MATLPAASGTMKIPRYNQRKPDEPLNSLVIPADNPLDWYIQPLPNLDAAAHYAATYGLTIVYEGEDE